jgi:aminopeptidase YwaD
MPAVGVPGLDRLLAAVSGQRLIATVAALAGDEFAGRRVGSPGGAAARAWLGDQLVEAGADVTLDGFAVRSVPEVYAAPTVEWRDGTATRRLVFGREVAVHLASADAPLAHGGRLGLAGQGDPVGRWLVVPPEMTLFDAYGHAHEAAGLLLHRGVDADGWQYTMLAGPTPGPLPILTIDPDTHAALTRAAAHDGAWLAGNTPIRRLDVPATNMHAAWAAPLAGAPGLLLTAHFDGVGDHPGLRQPAAADNASGVAVVLEATRLLAPALPDGVGLAAALLDAEEAGALGSAHHANRLRAARRTPWVINVDGAGHLRRATAVEAGGPAHGLLAALDQAGRHTGLPLVAGPLASDNRRYAAAGLPAVGIGAGMAGYHSPADTADRVQTTTMAALTRLVMATVWFAATSSAVAHTSTSHPRTSNPGESEAVISINIKTMET